MLSLPWLSLFLFVLVRRRALSFSGQSPYDGVRAQRGRRSKPPGNEIDSSSSFSHIGSRRGIRFPILGSVGPSRNLLSLLEASTIEEQKTEDSPSKSDDKPLSITTFRNPISTKKPRRLRFLKTYSRIPRKVVRTYTDYAARLWAETDPSVRRLIAKDKAVAAIRQVEQIVRMEEYMDIHDQHKSLEEAREDLLEACQGMLRELANAQSGAFTPVIPETAEEKAIAVASSASAATGSSLQPKKKGKRRSILFGAIMGAVVAAWVFSGNWIFTGVFTLMTVLGQLEYYRMVMNTGIYPARRISVIGACANFLTALFAPNLHQICLPMFGLWAMIWFLTMRRQVTSISEIATTFTGMFYIGYVPSFWVRIRLMGANRELTRLAPIVGPILEMMGRQAESLPRFIPQAVHLPITAGAIFIFWTWIALAFNDVGAYFIGKTFGKTKIGKVAPGAGAASPNKTVEGLLGGLAFSVAFSIAGAWVQKWPNHFFFGTVHGVLLGLVGLIGDLTASMLKRDAGLKDFGDLIPEHGGILDRVDGFIWSAPYSWLVFTFVVPALKARARAAIP